MSVYASEKASYLSKALHSIWHDQVRKPDQIVLVQDGPLPKELQDVISSFDMDVAGRLLLLKNDVNLGLPKSLNKGIEHCTGDYVARMDSDDIALPSRFRLQEQFMDNHPEIGILGGSIVEFNDDRPDLGTRTYPTDPDKIRRYICKANPLVHSTVMIRRSMVFDSGMRYSEKHRTSQDLALWYECLAQGVKVSNLEDIILKFRRDDCTLVRRGKMSSRADELAIYMTGIHKLYGPLSWRIIYPIARYMFRMLPTSLVRNLYSAEFRQRLLRGKSHVRGAAGRGEA